MVDKKYILPTLAQISRCKKIVLFRPAQLKRSGHVFLRLAAQSNDNDQEAEVFTRIVGRAAKNDFALHVDQGNTIQPPPIIDVSTFLRTLIVRLPTI